MSLLSDLHDTEKKLLAQLRDARRGQRRVKGGEGEEPPLTLGQKVADAVAATMGSWTFIIIQSLILAAWITLNLVAVIQHWDPYPFILLNLALSFQAAYAAPFIMMSQNRQQDIDRKKAENDYNINVKAELEIELLHQKLDELRENEILLLTQTVADLTQLLKQSGMCEPPATATALEAIAAVKPEAAATPRTAPKVQAAAKAAAATKPKAATKAASKPKA